MLEVIWLCSISLRIILQEVTIARTWQIVGFILCGLYLSGEFKRKFTCAKYVDNRWHRIDSQELKSKWLQFSTLWWVSKGNWNPFYSMSQSWIRFKSIMTERNSKYLTTHLEPFVPVNPYFFCRKNPSGIFQELSAGLIYVPSIDCMHNLPNPCIGLINPFIVAGYKSFWRIVLKYNISDGGV